MNNIIVVYCKKILNKLETLAGGIKHSKQCHHSPE